MNFTFTTILPDCLPLDFRCFCFSYFCWLPSLSLILTLPAGHCHLAHYSTAEQLFLLPLWLTAPARVTDCKSLAAGFPPQFLPHFGSNFSPGLLPYSSITWCVRVFLVLVLEHTGQRSANLHHECDRWWIVDSLSYAWLSWSVGEKGRKVVSTCLRANISNKLGKRRSCLLWVLVQYFDYNKKQILVLIHTNMAITGINTALQEIHCKGKFNL